MANHMWICPTKKQDEFYNISKLVHILKDRLPDLKYSWYDSTHWKGPNIKIINVYTEKIDSLFEMQCYTESLFDSTDPTQKNMIIDDLDEMGYEDLADKLIGFLENDGANPSRCIEIRHTMYNDEINKVLRFMRRYFQAIVFDEGVHPEYLLPLPENEVDMEKKEKGFIKKFIDWTNR